MKDVDLYRKWDSIWFLTKSLKKEGTENNTPTWAAYNSLITKALPVTIFCGLPLYPAPPTDWANLYAALQIYFHNYISSRKDHYFSRSATLFKSSSTSIQK